MGNVVLEQFNMCFSACAYKMYEISESNFHSPTQLKFLSHTDHICTIKNGAQQMM